MARILVVDDEPHLRLILEKQLESAGYDVACVGDGFAAVAEMRRRTPDLVLLDVIMPGMDGMHVVRWMKKNYRTASVPVIFLTARTTPEDRRGGLLEGVNDYLTKPYETSELILRIRNLLELSRRQRDANPLTGLPGNGAIQEQTQRRMSEGEAFALLHIDLDNFKSYNDYYGYQRGDHVIARTAELIRNVLDELCRGEGFAGHIGGDDFVVVTAFECGVDVANALVAAFDAAAPDFYEETDRSRGYIEVANRQGVPERFPLVSMTIAVALDAGGSFAHVGALGAVVSELKRHGKRQPGSVVVPDRRVEPRPAEGRVLER